MDTLRLTPGDLKYGEEVERLCVQISTINGGNAPLTLDLSNTHFLPTSSILSLVTAARLWRRQTGQPVIVKSLDPHVHAYLERINFFDTCREFLQCGAAPEVQFNRSTDSQRLLELTIISSDEETNSRNVRDLLRRAKLILQNWLNDNTLIGAVLTMMAEIGQNVVHSEDCGYTSIQRYKQSHTLEFEMASEIHIAVADLGIGIEESLARRHPDLRRRFRRGSEYILHAFTQGVSGKADLRGIGLSLVASIVQQRYGDLTVRSNRSLVRINSAGTDTRDDLAPIPGVQVSIVIRGTAANGA